MTQSLGQSSPSRNTPAACSSTSSRRPTRSRPPTGRAASCRCSGQSARLRRAVRRGSRPAQPSPTKRARWRRTCAPLTSSGGRSPFVDAYLSALFPRRRASLRRSIDETAAGRSARRRDCQSWRRRPVDAGDVPGRSPRAGGCRATRRRCAPTRMRLVAVRAGQPETALARTHFENLDNLEFHESVAALLVWSSMPVSTSIGRRWRSGGIQHRPRLLLGLRGPRLARRGCAGSHTARRSERRWRRLGRLRAAGRSNADLFRPARCRPVRAAGAWPDGRPVSFQPPQRGSADRRGRAVALRKIAAAVAGGHLPPPP